MLKNVVFQIILEVRKNFMIPFLGIPLTKLKELRFKEDEKNMMISNLKEKYKPDGQQYHKKASEWLTSQLNQKLTDIFELICI